MLETGIRGTQSVKAEESNSAKVMGSGTTKLEITHDAPTPLGMTVTCESELTEIDGRRLVFAVTAKDETGTVIGKGRHERFIVWEEKFQAKADRGLS